MVPGTYRSKELTVVEELGDFSCGPVVFLNITKYKRKFTLVKPNMWKLENSNDNYQKIEDVASPNCLDNGRIFGGRNNLKVDFNIQPFFLVQVSLPKFS